MEKEVIEGYRLSPQQRHLWRLLHQDAAPYRSTLALVASGGVDTEALVRAVRLAVERHEVLRTTFAQAPGMATAVQVIEEEARVEVSEREVGEGESVEEAVLREAEALRVSREGGAPRAVLVRGGSADGEGAGAVGLAVGVSAMQADERGMRNLFVELAACYAAEVGGVEVEGEVAQYADLSEPLNELLESEETAAGREYWRRLEVSEGVELGLEGSDGGGVEFRPEEVRAKYARVGELEEAARALGVGMEAVLLGCWQVLLGRLSGRGRVVVGVSFDGRNYEELSGAVGLLARTLPVAADLSQELKFSRFVNQLSTNVASISKSQGYYDWDLISSNFDQTRDEKYWPYAFEYRGVQPPLRAAGVEFRLVSADSYPDRFRLKLSASRSGSTLHLSFHYDASRFGRQRVRRLAAQYARLLDSLLAHPSATLAELDLVAAEDVELVAGFNRTETDFGEALCLHQRVERQATATPSSTAVEWEGGFLTYSELDARANRLAHHLLALGAERESLVAVYMERGSELVVALLAVLKAGCAYVPVDPSYPQQRVELMLRDSGAQVVLTQGRLAQGLGAAGGVRIVAVDDEWEEIALHDASRPAVEVSPDHLAYVIYTSGSTGTPKGVAVSHRSISNRLLWVLSEHPLDPGDALLQKTPVSFDASVWELFAPLMSGARVVLARVGGQQEPAYLLDAVRRHRITVLQVVPTMLAALVGLEGHQGLGSCESLRRVYSGGEALRPELVERFYERTTGLSVRLHNLYGPTECSIDATHLAMVPDAQESRVLIGRPLSNTRVYVLDALWRHCPVGVSGELYVSGVQLARCYLHRPALTAERFLPDPFADSTGTRMYRTGDVGRYLETGVLEYLGRTDEQVKLRGYRIELGEIEAAALSCPGVGQAAALLTEGEAGQPRLSLYVTAANGVGANGNQGAKGGGASAAGDGESLGEEVELPDGLRVRVANRQEASVLYHEIYETGGHLGHGIELSDGETVFDVGANAGLFTLYLCDRWRNLRVHAFEPVPAVFSLLASNVGRYGLDVRLHRAGLWRETGVVRMSYYPRWSSMSGAFGDEVEERELTRRVLERRGGEAAAHAEELMEGRFEVVEVECRMRTLSEVLAEEGVERIDLLKVDVEKSEEEVLAGIEEADWAKVRQVVLEVHDSEGRLERVEAQLRGRGYEVRSEQEGWLEGTGLYNVYAVQREVLEERERRGESGVMAERPGGLLRREAKVTGVEVRRHLTGRLPEYMVPATVVVLGRMPVTPSGKVDRRALPAAAASAEREGGDRYVAPRNEREEALCRIWGEVLRVERVGVRDNFFELGGDSILSLQVIARAARAGMRLTPRQVFDHPTVEELARLAGEAGEVSEEAEAGEAVGEAALTPIQERFLREQPEGVLDHYNQSLLLEAGEEVDEGALGEALRVVVSHHDALRARYERDDDGRWHQTIGVPDGDDAKPPLSVLDLTEVEDFKGAVGAAADQLQRSLSLREGPLLRATLLRTTDGGRLLLAGHHLVVDGVSWRVLLEDLQTAYSQLTAGKEASLPAKTTPYRRWAEALREYAASDEVAAQADYWVGRAEVDSLGVEADNESGENTTEWARGLTAELDEQYTTRLLKQAPEVYHTQINDLLLTALARALCSWVGAGADAGESCRVRVNLEGHGRNEELASGLDLTRTVGWFTSLFPVLLEVRAGEAPSETLKRVKEELRAVPDQGLGYGALRYLRDDEVSRRLAAASDSFIAFNYLGQTDVVLQGDGESGAGLALKAARESSGSNASAESVRSHLLDLNALVSGGRLRVAFTYPSRLLGEERVRALADLYAGELRRLVDHLLNEAEGGHTPSDFPQARLTQQKLDELWQRDVRPEAVYGLSPLQEGLLFHSLYEGGGELYVVQLSYRLEGELDEGALRRAWVEAARRHEALRTGYEWEGVEPMAAVVRREAELRWERLDWSHLSPDEQGRRLEEYLTAERGRGFDVRESPLTRQAVIVLGSGSHQFVWTFHHLIMDGWSGSMLAGEVARLYEAYAAGSEPVLEPAPRYREYMAWLGRQDLEAAERYWRERLSGVESPTLIASGRATGERRLVTAALTETVTARLTEAARRWQVTLSTLVQGAWALVLGRHTGREEVVYGVTVSGRPAELEGVERMVGLFINTLPARVRIEEGAGVEEWLRGMQAEAARMREYEYSPLSQVQGWSEAPKGGALFDSIVVFENYPVDQTLREWEGTLRIGQVRASETTNYAAAVVAVPGRELGLQLMYEAGAVGEGGAERLLGELGWVLEQLAEGEGLRVGEVEVVREEERRLLLHEWNDTAAEFADSPLLHALVERQASATPGSTAVEWEDGSLTYQQLDERANRLARHLLALGAERESLVAVYMERGPEMVMALLGILKAGCAYVPVDPSYPQQRVELMLSDSGAQVVLTQGRLTTGLGVAGGVRVVTVDDEWEEIALHDASRPAVEVSPDHLAYVIYTSGSTGTPKGAMNTHRAITNRLLWMQRQYQLRESDRVLQKTPFSFDVSVWEFFWPLMTGHCLVLAKPDGHRDAAYLVNLIRRRQLSVVHFVPSMLQVFLDEQGVEACESLRLVVCSGEALPEELRRKFRRLLRAELHNLYGPTEAAVDVTYFDCAEESSTPVVPIGRPVANTRVYVLDAGLRPVPVGVAGELFISGVQLARGYLRRAGLTAERFIADPYAQTPGARMYRTGDLCRWLSDGTVEYLGRLDHQVKLRGFRIELGEIEAAALTYMGVREAVAVVREEAGGGRLVAYVVAEHGAEVNQSQLRAHLAERLPEYMVPSVFVVLDSLPLTPSGKVDRRALPEPAAPRGESGSMEPRTQTEEMVAGIWSSVLGVGQVGARDNFFELGGHSLLATQVISRVRDAFGVEVGVRALFDAPTPSGLAAHVEAAVRDRQGLSVPPVRRGEAGAEAPLSFAQQRLWFLAQLEPGSAAYNVAAAVRLEGELDVEALGAALREVGRRHEVLRTRFENRGGRPVAVVEEGAELRVEEIDLRTFPEAEREREAARLVSEAARRGFDLGEWPLVRVRVVRVGEQERVLALVMHHIISDGWSLDVLIRELSALYGSYVRGEAAEPEPLPVQYADYARWQRSWMSGEVLELQLDYWKQKLAGAPPVIELPFDNARPASRSGRGGSYAFELSPDVARGLKELSRRESVTLYMAGLAAFQVLLHRYTGQSDIVVGTPVDNRNRSELEGLVGMFVNTLVLREAVEAGDSFRELLRRVRENVIEAHQHQEVPFEMLVDELGVERSLSHTPIIQVMFGVERRAGREVRLEGLEVSGVGVGAGSAQFDLNMTLVDTGDGLRGEVVYSTELFREETIRRLGAHLEKVMRAAVENPDEKVSRIDLLGAEERRLLLHEWNDTAAEFADNPLLHAFVERQAAATPGSTAVEWEDGSLTYQQLDERANRLARHLLALGVARETLVAVYMERSPELVVALLGVLKADCAYVPVDTSYPQQRVELMLRDSGAQVVLTQGRLTTGLAAAGGVRVVAVDDEWEEIALHDASRPAVEVSPDHLAYVIYTSGSTGTPKGVAISHRSISNRLLWVLSEHPLGADDAVLQKTSVSFDASVWELFVPLMSGARLVLARVGGQQEPAYLLDAVRRHRITVLQVVPTMLAALVEQEVLSQCTSLRRVYSGGEALRPELVERFYERTTGLSVRLHNLYGPTECSIDATHLAMVPGAGDEGVRESRVLIGRPLSNTRVYVLDASLRPVPVGVSGELYVSGVQLARGYLHRPSLTAERFLPDPFAETAGARMYRTGDLCRWLSDGTIEYLGRLDHQVKLRGFRIELGEIEAALRQHTAVREAVAVIREEGGGRLVAYVVAEHGAEEEVSSSRLRQYLAERLPEYMVPSAFVALEQLPLTPSGKVDRRALPEPAAPRGEASDMGPRTQTEEVISGIWEQVLGVERVGARDNFFELGGHSLLATQVVARMRDAFGVEVGVRAIFDTPTPSGLAAHVEAAMRDRQGLSVPPVRRGEAGAEAPLSFAQQRLWFLSQLEPGSTAYNIPAAVRLEGELDVEALGAALREVGRRHEVLRTRFENRGGRPVAVVEEGAELRVEEIDLRTLLQGERVREAERLVSEEVRRGFDLGEWPLVRVKLLRVGEAEYVLALVMHHIISDGWSVNILVKELSALYGSYVRGEAAGLEPLPVQYADYARWQRDWLQGEALEAALTYWKRQLDGAPFVLELPTDHPRPAVRSNRGAAHPFRLPKEVADGLRRLSRDEGATLFMTLFAAFQLLLQRHTGQDDLLTGTPVAGRNRVEIERLIGFFVNTLVIRTDLSGDPTFNELVARVREVSLEAHAYQDVPFEKLVDELEPERDLSRTPLFQVMFAWQTVPVAGVEVEGLSLRPVEAGSGTAKFDLTLEMVEAGESVTGVLEYSTDLFEAGTVERMVERFQSLLAEIAAEPRRRLSELSVLTEEEHGLLLDGWNNTAAEFADSPLLHALVERQASATPGSTAVEWEDGSLTYQQLDERANHLARHLLALGAERESLVAVYMERGPEMVVALLAILKAGCAYVPVDPSYPRQRVELMLGDSGAQVVLTQGRLAGGLAAAQGVRVVAVDDEWEEIARHSGESPGLEVEPDQLAYVIYTSGSTGTPKGAMNTHRAITNRLLWMQRQYQLRESDRVLQKTPFSFDVSVWEFFWPLMTGHCLVLAKPDGHRDAAYLVNLIRRRQLSVVHFVPSMLQVFLDEQGVEACESLRLVVCSGEALPEELRRKFRRLLKAELYNLYGPTEAAVEVTYFDCAEESSTPVVPIGRPVANTRVYVLDERLRPVPMGVAGELFISGVQLARGYLRRAGLTAERFIADPYAQTAGARMYRTGDLCRWLSDGTVEYLGRLDHQVKLRGFRIELGEIEAAALTYMGVREAVAVVREEGGGHLVAYVVAEHGAEVNQSQLRTHLAEHLPEYMVPGVIVRLDALPLTPSGKVDRRALPEPAAPRSESGGGELRTQAEEMVADIWASMLGIERVGIRDNFFELGGHSLLATQVISRVRDAFGVEVGVRALFDAPTPSGLAAHVEAAMRDRQGLSVPPVTRGEAGAEAPLSFAQQRLWFLSQLEPGSAAYNIPAAVRLEGELDAEALGAALREVGRRHEVLRTRFENRGGRPVAVVEAGAELRVEEIDLRGLAQGEREREVARLVDEEARRGFELGEWPLMRVRLLRVGEAEYVLALVMHHIISDGWSMRLLIQELGALYEAYRRGEDSPLEELEIQYADYARWQRDWLQGEALEAATHLLEASTRRRSLRPRTPHRPPPPSRPL